MNKVLFATVLFMTGCTHSVAETTPVKESNVTHVIIVHQRSPKENSDIEQNHTADSAATVNIFTEKSDTVGEFTEKASTFVSDGASWVWDKSKNAWIKATSEESKQKVKSAWQGTKSFVSEKLDQVKSKFD